MTTAPLRLLDIDPAKQFDEERVFQDILSARDAASDDLRSVITEVVGRAHQDAFDDISRAFRACPEAVAEAIHAWSDMTDSLIRTVTRATTDILHPLANPTTSETFAVIAVGGYGRAEMAPFSDIDLLFLKPAKSAPWVESVVETMLYILWDLRLKIGHATRSITDCIRLGRADFTIRTSLLESRFVTGDPALAEDMQNRLWSELFKDTGKIKVGGKRVFDLDFFWDFEGF